MITHSPPLISLPDVLAERLFTDCYITQYGVFSRADLLAHAHGFSKQLPEKSYAINLCQNRYLFIVAYLAVMLRKQISLLPPNQSPKTLERLLDAYTPGYCITDSQDAPLGKSTVVISYAQLSRDAESIPPIDTERTVSISFTSGSTGQPKAIAKNWREFQRAAELALQQLKLADKAMTLVSTVPPQHMYGLETSLFWPLFSNLSLQDSRPFFPEDVRSHLRLDASAKLLVSTPTHLQACLQSNIAWPTLSLVLSSTAPLPPSLAVQIEQRFNAPLYELLGSTETLSFACRRSATATQWQPYQGIRLTEYAGVFSVQGGHLMQPIALDDLFSTAENGAFTLLGRSADLIKIAGKRASLSELNTLLTSIAGISEGIFFSDTHGRLSALVVSDLAKKTILAELRQSLDPVFLPRRILRTPALPRTATGKLIKAELDKLIRELQHA